MWIIHISYLLLIFLFVSYVGTLFLLLGDVSDWSVSSLSNITHCVQACGKVVTAFGKVVTALVTILLIVFKHVVRLSVMWDVSDWKWFISLVFVSYGIWWWLIWVGNSSLWEYVIILQLYEFYWPFLGRFGHFFVNITICQIYPNVILTNISHFNNIQ